MTETPRGDYTEPRAMEIEAARLLENEHREELEQSGLTAEQVRKLADDYIAETDGEPAGFVEWAKERARAGDAPSG